MTEGRLNRDIGRALIDSLVRHDITCFIISPGSRSTSLAIAAVEHKSTITTITYDERGAAYYAVGYARATGLPMAAICTSGTAVANYSPAVVEAWQSRLPLVLLTADRPSELQNRGANQTIDQINIFGKYAAETIVFEAKDGDFSFFDLQQRIDSAFDNSPSLPIHINWRLKEPLIDPGDDEHQQETPFPPRGNPEMITQTPSSLSELSEIIARAQRGMIIAGPESAARKSTRLTLLAEHVNWPVLADILSQQRGNTSRTMLQYYDTYLDVLPMTDRFRPDCIIHTGDWPTSKRLQKFMAFNHDATIIGIHDHDRIIDPDYVVNRTFRIDFDSVADHLITTCPKQEDSQWLRTWRVIDDAAMASLLERIDLHQLSEPGVFLRLRQLLRDTDALFVAGSMPVRDADSFFSPSEKTIIGANRGASGIDGTIASACGFAAGSNRPTTLVIGDLAFIHDMNSLLLTAKSNQPIKIIVINNDGGGIFHFLQIVEQSEHFETLFGTPHGLTFDHVATQFGLAYSRPKDLDEFADDFTRLHNGGQSGIIEIVSDRVENVKRHREIRDAVHATISRMTAS